MSLKPIQFNGQLKGLRSMQKSKLSSTATPGKSKAKAATGKKILTVGLNNTAIKRRKIQKAKAVIPADKPVFGERGAMLREQIENGEIEAVYLLEPAQYFDQAIVGLTDGHGEPRIVYDCERCIEALMKSGISDRDEAEEFFLFNTLGAYMEGGPLFVNSLTPLARLADEKRPRKIPGNTHPPAAQN